jgi:hypothetical protein
MWSGTIPHPLSCSIMIAAPHIALLHIQRVLMLAGLLTYFAPMMGSVESSLLERAALSASSHENVTIAYEVMNASAASQAIN